MAKITGQVRIQFLISHFSITWNLSMSVSINESKKWNFIFGHFMPKQFAKKVQFFGGKRELNQRPKFNWTKIFVKLCNLVLKIKQKKIPYSRPNV